jgi:hypothetical protein
MYYVIVAMSGLAKHHTVVASADEQGLPDEQGLLQVGPVGASVPRSQLASGCGEGPQSHVRGGHLPPHTRAPDTA